MVTKNLVKENSLLVKTVNNSVITSENPVYNKKYSMKALQSNHLQ